MKKSILLVLLMLGQLAFADITVSDVEVFSGFPWKEVIVGYTITGNDANANGVKLIASDKSANTTYAAKTLKGGGLAEGRHVVQWNAAADGVRIESTNVVFTVSVVSYGGVQLWENGPYWAECNVGASKPEDYGYYFWWGDTVGCKHNGGNKGWTSLKNGAQYYFSTGNCPTYGMSNAQLQSAGYIDSMGNLASTHDAATAHLGAPWRLPTDADFVALSNNCRISWMKLDGVYGRFVQGKGKYASKSIFLPAAGYGSSSLLSFSGSSGFYMSSTPDLDDSNNMWYLSFGTDYFCRESSKRYIGRTVRPLHGVSK